MILRCLRVAICGLSFGSALGGAAFYGMGDLPGGDSASYALGISADGSTVAGWSYSDAGQRATRWSAAGGLTDLGVIGDYDISAAFQISADGATVVGSLVHSGTGSTPFRWTQSEGLVDIGTPPANPQLGIARAVSADGSVIVGEFKGRSQALPHAFRWTPSGGSVRIDGDAFHSVANDVSPDGSVVVGQVDTEAFRWTEQDGLVRLGANAAHRISGDGSVITGGDYVDDHSEAVIWDAAGRMTTLDPTPGWGADDWWAGAMSYDGSIIIGYETTSSASEACIWGPDRVARNLKEMLVNDYGLSLDGWTLTTTADITPDGSVITGYGINPDGNTEGWIAVIPEPGTGVLLVLPVLFGWRRGRSALQGVHV